MSSSSTQSHGFDAAVTRRDDDYLNRWPLAREIYGIATTGSPDWSVRIGIYGEWGTGKTSVLEFITSMAKHDGQTVIRFNPWQHSSKNAMWRAFVTAIYNQPIFHSMERAGWVRLKQKSGWFLDRGKIAQEGAKVLNEKAGQAVGAGLDIIKDWFSFSSADLKAVQTKLRDKRIIVIIDDLDRTAPELVPEILFALKELMNIPGFSFICAFDPVVIGQVLGRFHPGFGDGLRFLEKIIDYPRWLPPPSAEGLAKLAIADAKQYCDYVPEADLRDAIEFLPQNPRSVRQFIRLLKLLEPQIKRHDEDELRWPVILAANVIKVTYPRLAPALLGDIDFWEEVGGVAIMDRSEEQGKLTETVTSHVDTVDASQKDHLKPAEKAEIVRALIPLCQNSLLWFGTDADVQIYQMHIAESPHAVTRKEFKEFLGVWERDSSFRSIKTWISSHAEKVERQTAEIYSELLDSSLDWYLTNLQQRDTVQLTDEVAPIVKMALSLIALLECLVLELGGIDTPNKLIRPQEIENLFEAFARILKTQNLTADDFGHRNAELLLQIIGRWHGDVSTLINAIRPYGNLGSSHYDGPDATSLHQRLSAAILPVFAAQVINGLRESGFVHRVWTHDKATYQIRCLLLDHEGALWKDSRKTLLKVISEAGSNKVIQGNIYELLQWFHYGLDEKAPVGDPESLKKLFKDKELLDSLWASATAKVLSPYATLRLNNFVISLKKIGVSLNLPPWWADSIHQIALQKAANQLRES